ncbi:MAG: QacE family quaternary ammonium compound efflux SMR transporter [Mesorhizobium sp.]|uniref:DMT family transporter n=1 Tax=Mesorhizobium sp. TaxID=1871066 RepID=UPI000FE69993|nr:SMR family transporter [Mesorhizobium sp.]RWD30649.1 MAG: QacE family quaternary ammonium compound efflux SMR transporter [Mesorhizobium sp.]RWI77142.1 MAG: QacE family quaternary ammonium compound efflux SMR transporter [Mesorhizobium sp.]
MNPLVTAYGALVLGIVSEVIGSSLLPRTQQFTKLGPTAAAIASFIVALFFLSHALKLIPLGVTYAIWCGVGMVLTAMVSVHVYRSPLDLPAILGIILIICGVVVINIFSKTVAH